MIDKAHEMYLNDPTFRAIVNTMAGAAEHHGYTPHELRMAASLAAYHVEMRAIPKVVASREEMHQIADAILLRNIAGSSLAAPTRPAPPPNVKR